MENLWSAHGRHQHAAAGAALSVADRNGRATISIVAIGFDVDCVRNQQRKMLQIQ
jgi:hypothetical protein